jgi:hypothetical protein
LDFGSTATPTTNLFHALLENKSRRQMILLKTKRSLPKNKAILERNWHKLVDKLKVMITDVQELFIKWTKISESGWRRISTTLDCPGRLPVTPIKPMMI